MIIQFLPPSGVTFDSNKRNLALCLLRKFRVFLVTIKSTYLAIATWIPKNNHKTLNYNIKN